MGKRRLSRVWAFALSFLLSAAVQAQSADLRSANELIKQGKPGEALQLLRSVQDKDGNAQSPEYHYLMGIAASDAGDADAALTSLFEAVRLRPDFPQAYAEI